MASGNHGQRIGFNESGKPNDRLPCPAAAAEPRGPGLFLVGLCVACGRATTRRDQDGQPRHEQPAAPEVRLRLRPPPPEAA